MSPYEKMMKEQQFYDRICGKDLQGNPVKDKKFIEPLREIASDKVEKENNN